MKGGTTESGDTYITNSRVEGNGINGTSGGIGLKNTITIVSIQNTTVVNNIGYGIIVDNSGGPFTASNNTITGNTQRGFYAVGSNYICTFTNNEVSNNGSHISLNISNGVFSGNKVYNNGLPINLNEGAVTVYGNGWKISSNTIYNNPTHGLYIEGSNNLVDGNIIYGNSQKQDTYYDNIKLLSGSNNNTLQNNQISKGNYSNAPGYGIRINGGSSNNRVTGNIMNGNGGKLADIIGDYIQ
jgi:parallel beta-helix repeat protein